MSLTKVSYSMIQGAPINVLDYGAIGDGTTDDTDACQAALDAAYAAGGGVVVFPSFKTFLMGAKVYSGVTGAASLVLKTNVTIQLDGTIKMKNSAYGAGAYFAIIRTLDAGASNIRITGRGTIDGNKANQTASVQCSNIMLKYAISNVVVENINSINANGMGIQVVGANPTPGQIGGCENIRISGTTVSTCSYIGIQCAQFNHLRIENNYVSFTTDNAIDIYGENNGSTVASGTNFVISGNTCENCLTGVFAETVANGTISGNNIYLSPVSVGGSGIHVNRINGQPYGINITGNAINNIETGVLVTGDMGGVFINSNIITKFSAGGVSLGNGGNCSYVDVSNNFFTPNNNTVGIINMVGPQIAFITGRFNTVNSTNIASSYLAYINSPTVVNVHVDSFRVIPNQTSNDLTAISPTFGALQIYDGSTDNTAGPVDITPPDSTGGHITVTSYHSVTGRSTWIIPYSKFGTSLTLGTPQTTVITADPITGVTSVGGAARVALLSANTFVKWGFVYTPIA